MRDKTFCFFSHTIKAQADNMDLLDAMLEKNVRSVICTIASYIEILLIPGVSIMRRWTMQVESESLPLVRSKSFCVLF